MNLTKFRFIVLLLIIIGAITVGYKKAPLLNEVELVSGLGIDKVDDQYVVTMQVFNPAANQKNASEPTGGYTYTQSGHTITEALKNIKKDTMKVAFLYSLQVVALSESLVKEEGLKESLDFLVRDPNIPARLRTIIVKGKSPKEFLQMFTPLQKLSAVYTDTMLENSKDIWGNLINTSSERIGSLLADKTSDVIIPYVVINGDVNEGMSKGNLEQIAPPSTVSLDGFAVFKGDKLDSYLSFDESNTLALLKGVHQINYISAPCPNGNGEVSIETIRTNSSITSNINPLTYHVQVSVKGNLEENACKENVESPASRRELQNQLQEKIKTQIIELLKKEQENGTDPIGLRDALYRQHPKEWKEKYNHNNNFDLDDVKVSVRVEFVRFGYTKQ
ncbi:Ger(x)C family spore germination protein [Falsibacillus pallidus]|uniref:Ger(x)C family spore germination protein n=1 Tax=Falsibacillus pallidus TaxID=493781 RepID=UPI003D9716C1